LVYFLDFFTRLGPVLTTLIGFDLVWSIITGTVAC
jgi:hypothetical protein